MTNRLFSLFALGAGLALGGLVVAQDQPGREPAPAGGQEMRDMGTTPGGMPGIGGQQASQQFSQTLDQIAKDPKTAGDKLFLLSAGLTCRWTYELSQQAQQKAHDPQVKQLAQRIVQEHGQIGDRLKQTAQKVNLQLPQELPQFKQQELRIFTSLPADQFDKHYVAAMQAAHALDVTTYQAASQIALDNSIKEFAGQQVAALQQHQQEISRTATALGLPSGMEAVPAAGKMTPATPGGDMDRRENNPGEERGDDMNR